MAGQSSPVVPWHGIRETPVVLLTGTESFLADRALRILTDRMKSSDAGVEINDLDAADYQQGDLLQLASPSLFGEPRLLRVQAVEKCNDAFLEDALSYLSAPEADVVVVLRHGGGNRGKKLLDALKSAGAAALVVECKEIKKDAERVTFVQQEFQRHGVTIEPRAVRALVDAFSTDLAELASACSQLITDVGSAGITAATVERYYGGRVEATTFQIADQAISGHFAEALALLRHAMNSGVEPVLVVAAFAMKLRTMALVGGASGSIDAVAGELGMAPWQARNARSSLQGWDQAGLGAAILEVAHTDGAVKGSGPNPEYALERMVRVVAMRGKAMELRAG
jgi:DNA polymerase III subunit delta